MQHIRPLKRSTNSSDWLLAFLSCSETLRFASDPLLYRPLSSYRTGTPPKTVLYTASAVGFCKRSHSKVSHLNGWAFGSSGVWDELGLAPCTVSGVSEFGGLLVFEFWRYFSLWYSICSGKGELGLLCFLLILVWLGWFDCRAGAAKVPRASGERSLRCLVGLERWRWWPMFLVWCGVLRWKSCDFVSDCLIWIAVGCLWFLCFLDFF